MKIVTWSCIVWLSATAAFAGELSKDQVKRLSDSAVILSELRDTPEKGIPADTWSKTECVVVIPSLKKAAFIFGGEYGSGVMSCRQGAAWSAPVFMQLAKGSWGFQVGAESIDLVLLVMNRRGLDKMLSNKVTLGADASVAAGPVGRSANAATDGEMKAEMLSYSRASGLFAGVNISGGTLQADKDGDARAYGAAVGARDIVNGTQGIVAPPEARVFLDALTHQSRVSEMR